jgi:hypothetical protein
MRYLKKFNESIDNQLIEDCKYILSELSDKGILVNATMDEKGLFIDIESKSNSDNDYIKLNEYQLEFEHLLSFLESYGYKESAGETRWDGPYSYVTNDTWDPNVFCPNCGNDNTDDIIGGEDYKTKCYHCDYESSSDQFLDFRHKIDEGDLHYFIKDNYWVESMSLYFKRV